MEVNAAAVPYRMVLPDVALGVNSVGSQAPGWQYVVDDSYTDSRLGVLKAAVSVGLQKHVMREAAASDAAWKLVGRTPRWTQWLTRSGCSCPYAYGSDVVLPQEFPAWVVDVMQDRIAPHLLSHHRHLAIVLVYGAPDKLRASSLPNQNFFFANLN